MAAGPAGGWRREPGAGLPGRGGGRWRGRAPQQGASAEQSGELPGQHAGQHTLATTCTKQQQHAVPSFKHQEQQQGAQRRHNGGPALGIHAQNSGRATAPVAQQQHPNHKQRLTALVDLVHGGKRVEGRIRVQDQAVHGARLRIKRWGVREGAKHSMSGCPIGVSERNLTAAILLLKPRSKPQQTGTRAHCILQTTVYRRFSNTGDPATQPTKNKNAQAHLRQHQVLQGRCSTP